MKSLGKEKIIETNKSRNSALSTIDIPKHSTRETLSKELKISSGKLDLVSKRKNGALAEFFSPFKILKDS